jgi:hypothetical protein
MPIPSGEWPLKPILADFVCVACRGAGPVRVAVVTSRFIYPRCDHCAEVWSMPERRGLLNDHLPGRPVPLKAELRRATDHTQNDRVLASRAPG